MDIDAIKKEMERMDIDAIKKGKGVMDNDTTRNKLCKG